MPFALPVRDGVELRLLEMRHAAELFALARKNHDRLKPWMAWAQSLDDVKETRRHIRDMLRQFARGEGIACGIFENDKIIGTIGMHDVSTIMKRVELGYWIDADSAGRGTMTDAVRAMVDYAFGEMGMNRISIVCATDNTPSRAIPEKLGFTNEGTLRESTIVGDKKVDNVMYSLLRREWESTEV